MTDADVVAKKERAIKYCNVATKYNLANGGKPWKYVFIPASEIGQTATIEMLFRTFVKE